MKGTFGCVGGCRGGVWLGVLRARCVLESAVSSVGRGAEGCVLVSVLGMLRVGCDEVR